MRRDDTNVVDRRGAGYLSKREALEAVEEQEAFEELTPEELEFEAGARERGWIIGRGAFYGTSDDRADRWYVERVDTTIVDRRGAGYLSKREALEALEEEKANP